MLVKLYDHPFAGTAPKEFQVDNLAKWLVQYYEGTPPQTLRIYSGQPSESTDITENLKAILNAEDGEYTILQNPGEAVTVTAILTQIAIAIAVAVIMSMLFPVPEMPNNVNRSQSSPNNSLASRSNQVRFNQRVEDIYGTVKSIPSLMMPTYIKYRNNKQMEYGYYCVGRGYYDINSLKDGDTLVESFTDASAAIYEPFTSPNNSAPSTLVGEAITDPIVSVYRSTQVDGITLPAYNQLNLPATAQYTLSTDEIIQSSFTPNVVSIAQIGDTATISMSNTLYSEGGLIVTVTAATKLFTVSTVSPLFQYIKIGDSVTFSGFTSGSNNGTFVVATKPSTTSFTVTAGTFVDVTDTNVTASTTLNYSGNFTILDVQDGVLVIDNPSTYFGMPLTTTCAVSLPVIEAWTDWFVLSKSDRDRVWVNVLAQAGMYKAKSSKMTTSVSYTVQVEKLDSSEVPTGLVETVNGTISAASSDEQALTSELLTSWTGNARVRVQRTTAYDYSFQGTIVDEIKLVDLYSVSPVTKLHFGNKTTIHTVTKVTPRATAAKERQLNCLASRKLPVYDGAVFSGAFDADGALVSGSIHATSKISDIIAAIASDPIIGSGIDQVDMNQIHAVQQELSLWDSEAGQFNYTFDSDSISLEETISAVANAGFCIAYRQNGKIRLALDKLQSNSTALFTHRNKKPNSETITRVFSTDSDYDGVEFVYQDPNTEQSETIKLPLDGTASKYKKYEIPGIRSFTQAWYRANREYQKLKHQRLNIETDCTTDARLLLPNSRVDIVDNTRFKSFDGEVVNQSGLTLTLSRDVEFTSGNHSIILMRRDGTLQTINCTATASTNQVVLQSLPTEPVVTTNGQDGIRTIFSFASDDARLSQAWLVQEINLSDSQYVNIKAINYMDIYYFYDTQVVPSRDSVIN